MNKRPKNSISRKTSSSAALILVAAALVYFGLNYFQKAQAPGPTLTVAPAVAITSAPATSGATGAPAWLAVYFTNPNPPDALGTGIDQYVQPVIEAASRTIDVTSFDLNLPSLVNALAAASKRGVSVRVVYDGTNGSLDLNNAATGNMPFDAIKTLKSAGVALVDGGRSSGLMHDKMVIVDGATLFMGSWNLSYNDTYRNNNNLLKITDPKLIANYQAKFNELFVDKHFGAKAKVKVPNPSLVIDGVTVENYMAPEDEVMAKLVQYVGTAQKTVHYMIFTYTHDDLANAMIARAKAGVQVEGVIENRGASQGSLVPLFCAGMPVKTDGNKYTMHHKVIVIDGQTVVTGSFNFTRSADTENDDNVLVIHSPAVAAIYEQEYQKVSSIGLTPQAADIKCK